MDHRTYRDSRDEDTEFDVEALRRLKVAVAEDQADLETARNAVADLEDGLDPFERREPEAAVEQARVDLMVVRDELADLELGLNRFVL